MITDFFGGGLISFHGKEMRPLFWGNKEVLAKNVFIQNESFASTHVISEQTKFLNPSDLKTKPEKKWRLRVIAPKSGR